MTGSKVRVLLALTGLLWAVTLYQLCPIFPDTATNRPLKMVVCTFMNSMELIGSFGERFGISSTHIFRFFAKFAFYSHWTIPSVMEKSTDLAGVPVIIYRPTDSSPDHLPTIVYFHGGGWSTLTPEVVSPLTRLLAEHTHSVVVSVNYRKAPEHLFPAAFNDCLAVTRYILQHGAELGINTDKVGVKGDSAGGNLALAVALYLSNKRSTQHAHLSLVSVDNPALQATDFYLPSYVKYENGPCFLNKRVMLRYWLNYAFGNYGYLDQFYVNNHTSFMNDSPWNLYVNSSLLPHQFQQELLNKQFAESSTKNEHLSNIVQDLLTNPYFAPLMASDDELRHLPPVYITVVEFDVLRDDSFILAERLRRLGSQPEVSYYPSEMHSFQSFILVDEIASEELLKFAGFLKNIMATK